MKAKRLFITLITVLLLAGCAQITITGSGNVVNQEESITGFDQVHVENSFEVSITQGESFKVVISVDDNLLEYVDVKREGSSLKIGLKPNRSYSIFNATMKVEVVMPELSAVELSGNSLADITGFSSSDNFEAGLSGSSLLRGDIEAGETRLRLSGSSEVLLNGSGADLRIDTSGSSLADLSDFSAENADLNLSGSSSVTVNVNGTLDVSASGSSQVYYLGEPTIRDIDTSGSSSVQQR